MANHFASLARNKLCLYIAGKANKFASTNPAEHAMTPAKAIQKLLDAASGSASVIAAALGDPVKRQNVEYWLRVEKFPPEHCPALEREFGIACDDLRSDLKWVRVDDPAWPKGKPLLDVAAEAA